MYPMQSSDMFSKITWSQINSGPTARVTELLLVHLSETWRTAMDANKVVAVAFVDFKKALTVYLTLSYCTS